MTNPDQQVIHYYQFTSELEQYQWIVQKIRQLLAQGQSPGNIAIINRKHKELATLASWLQMAKIPIFYEKGQDVLQKPLIQQLITLLKFIHSLGQKDTLEADFWLPTILSFPFWEVDPTDIWKLSIFAYQQPTAEGRLWLTCLLQANQIEVNGQKLKNPEKLEQIAQFLLNLATQAKHLPIEQLIDQIIDSHWPNWSDEDEELVETTKPTPTKFHTNFAQYYFHQYLDNPLDLVKPIPVSTVDFLSNLRTLLQTIRQHRSKEVLYLSDFLEFLELTEKNQISIIDRSTYGSSNTGVNLLTAHKAKGLEFSVVFIPNCNQNYWFGKGRVDKLSLPDNILLSKDQENEDDYLRLLFVAITRAKDQLYLTRYTTTDDGQTLEPIGYLETSLKTLNIEPTRPLDSNTEAINSTNLQATTLLAWQKITGQPDNITISTNNWLTDLLANYQLSVTHLNDFLDLEKGGPLHFVQKHLLKFPQSPSPQAAYGTAMHNAVTFLLSQPKTVTLEQLLEFFAQRLLEQRLNPTDYAHYAQLGKTNLTTFYQNYTYYNFTNYKLEYDFSSQVVQIGQAKLTGKIDYLALNNTNITVIDFKTGKPVSSWTGRNPQEQSKLWRYRNQLLFYKLLVENSPNSNSSLRVTTGQLQFLDAHYLTNPKPQDLILSTNFDTTETSRLSKLIQIVYQKIVTLDFPDVSQYPPTFQGTQEFCEDLLK